MWEYEQTVDMIVYLFLMVLGDMSLLCARMCFRKSSYEREVFLPTHLPRIFSRCLTAHETLGWTRTIQVALKPYIDHATSEAQGAGRGALSRHQRWDAGSAHIAQKSVLLSCPHNEHPLLLPCALTWSLNTALTILASHWQVITCTKIGPLSATAASRQMGSNWTMSRRRTWPSDINVKGVITTTETIPRHHRHCATQNLVWNRQIRDRHGSHGATRIQEKMYGSLRSGTTATLCWTWKRLTGLSTKAILDG